MELYYLDTEYENYFSNKKKNNNQIGNCMNYEKFNNCISNVEYGYQRPLNERCPIITGQLNNEPKGTCSSLWNNLTRRKSLIIKE